MDGWAHTFRRQGECEVRLAKRALRAAQDSEAFVDTARRCLGAPEGALRGVPRTHAIVTATDPWRAKHRMRPCPPVCTGTSRAGLS